MGINVIDLAKRPLTAVLCLLPLLLLTACESAPTPEELRSAHYGHYPSNYHSATRKILEDRHQTLGDPFEVVSVSAPTKDYEGGSGSRTWGYSSEIVYNAPNSAVGATVYHYREKVFFHNGRVVDVKNTTNVGDVMMSAVANNLAAATGSDQSGGGDDSDDGSGGAADDSGGTDGSTSGKHGGKRTAVKTSRGTTTQGGGRQAALRTNRPTTAIQQKKAPAPAATYKKKN